MTSHERLEAFGNQLIDVHLWLREELSTLRANVAAYLTDLSDVSDGAPLRELRTHCLTFCSALNRHHRGEERTAFSEIAAQFPELSPVLEELRRDHRLVEDSLQRIETLVGELTELKGRPGPGEDRVPVEVQREVDSLAALIETHFTYEEKRIVSALNALDLPAWRHRRPAFLRKE
ncbi:hemerythrin domain-containing protein [Streptomyces sp. URMC 127]|uniref:hemerythrin domain-containing protein n=1 Tax=Streptomyces sp. URMC 127 TaxID=3423402 RepID=UPI003F19F817